MAETKRSEPWWLAGADERCPVCLQRYALQVEVRCIACDRGVCQFCAVVVEQSRERVCAGCHDPSPARRGG